jgi:tetratricopeptide (TPR) repeat protein
VYKLTAILLSAAILVGCQPADPVQRASPELQRQYNAAFQDMLNKPGDLEVALNYAKVATKVGDLEGAISTYEGMLIIDPNLSRVRLELGVLYYRLKSYEVARSYLETALQSPTLKADLRKPAEELLAKMPKQSRSRGS